MKKFFILSFSFISVYVKAQTIYPSGVPNCIARYDFGVTQTPITNLQDVSGNNNNSSIVENLVPTTSWRNLPDKAMLFNGVNSYAIIPNSANLNPQAVTMVALVKLNGFYNGDCQFSMVIIKGQPGYIPGQYGLAVTDDVYDYDCHNFDTKHQQLIGLFNQSYTTAGMQPNPGNYIETGKWYFLAISFTGSSLNYYQVPMETDFHYDNIAPIYSASNIANYMGNNNQDISIGYFTHPIFPYWFNGAMDEVALFSKALAVKEIQSVYDYLWYDGVTATKEITVQNIDISFYPNPNKGSFTIKGNSATDGERLSYQIINTLGQVVHSGSFTSVDGTIQQNINIPENLRMPGVYMFVLNHSGQKFTKMITISK